MNAITDAWDKAKQAAERDPLTVRDVLEVTNSLQDLRDAMLEFADNPPAEKPIKIHIAGENFNRQFKDIDALTEYLLHLMGER